MSDFSPQAFCNPALCDMVAYQPGKTAREIEAQYGISDSVKLASNENILGASEHAIQAVRQALPLIHLYPAGKGDDLKQLLATHYKVSEQNITLTNGSNEALELLARCFLSQGKKAIYSQHAFAVYEMVTKLSGAYGSVAQPHVADDKNMPYGHNLSAIYQLIDADTAMIFIANPNNPTGTWLTSSELYDFISAVPEHIIVVVDEAYAEYAVGVDCADCTQWLGEFDNLVITRTFSKLYALAGLRIGYVLSSEEIATLLDRLRQPFNVNALAQQAAIAAFSDQVHIDESQRINRQGLELLRTELSAMGIPCLPSCANFICCEVGEAKQVYQFLIERGVIVRPIAGYNLPCHLRVTVGLPEHNERFLSVIKQAMDEQQK